MKVNVKIRHIFGAEVIVYHLLTIKLGVIITLQNKDFPVRDDMVPPI